MGWFMWSLMIFMLNIQVKLTFCKTVVTENIDLGYGRNRKRMVIEGSLRYNIKPRHKIVQREMYEMKFLTYKIVELDVTAFHDRPRTTKTSVSSW